MITTYRGIKGLTDRVAPKFPELGTLRKGGPRRTKRVKKNGRWVEVTLPGEDLDHWRFVSDREDVVADFHEAYGEDPPILEVVLPYPTIEGNWRTCKERWGKTQIHHRCDGEQCYLWRDESGVVHTAPPADPIPCPGGCAEVGYLSIYLPRLWEYGHTGTITVITHSIHDIISIQGCLQMLERQLENNPRIGLREVMLTLSRRPRKISAPIDDNGRRARVPKHLVFLEPSAEWMRKQLAMAREAAIVRELPPPDWEEVTHPGQTIAEVEGRALPEPEAVEGEVVEEPDPEGEPNPAATMSRREWGRKVANGITWRTKYYTTEEGELNGDMLKAAINHLGLDVDVHTVEQAVDALHAYAAEQQRARAWPEEVIEAAFNLRGPDGERCFYEKEHVVATLEESGLRREEEPEVLLDWLASHVREEVYDDDDLPF